MNIGIISTSNNSLFDVFINYNDDMFDIFELHKNKNINIDEMISIDNINLLNYDIIFFVMDINNIFKKPVEYDILNKLLNYVKSNSFSIILLLDNCDDMYFDDVENDLILNNKIHENNYEKANNLLSSILSTKRLKSIPFLPFASSKLIKYRNMMYLSHEIFINKIKNTGILEMKSLIELFYDIDKKNI